ncbi:MAG: hypothetical protein MR580_01250 [Anaerolactibacter massiliensis]|nr:hypothetical protein [Anaerolactibacter massiliensis]
MNHLAKRITSVTLAAMLVAGTGMNVFAEGDGDNGGTPPSNGSAPQGTPPSLDPGSGGAPDGGGGSAITEWTAVKEYSEDTTETDGTYDSTGTDENAIDVSGGNVVFSNPTITRTSSESSGGDDSSFYGAGAALLATGGTAYVSGGSIAADADGAAGAFAYHEGTIYIAGTTINTRANTAGGIHVAGGGTLYAYDLDVTTQGESSAAIRSDRGGGTMVVDGGSYTSNGTGSPAVYVTADITINHADLTANGSEGVCIEGLNTLRLFNSNLTSNMQDLEQNDSTWSVILYQSMSGDSEVGNSSFYMIGGTLNSENGGLFYTTNTESDFYLENVAITQSADAEYFLRVSGNANQRGWGTTGSNGAETNFTANDQTMNGDVIWDSISELDFYMENGSSLTGAIYDDETYAGNGGSGYANVYIDSSSTWTVTGDSTVTNLYNEGTIIDADGKTVSIVGTDGTVYVQGDSSYTITVTSYSDSADFSGAITSVSYDDYAVAMPSELGGSTVTAAASETTSAPEESPAVQAVSEDAEKTSSEATIIIVAAAAALVIALVMVLKHRNQS